jgi:ABC-2 type transport system permease protein
MWSRSLAVARNETRVMLTDIGSILQLVLMPIVMIAFLKPVFKATLQQAGQRPGNGAEQAVPGMAVMFAFFLVGFVAFAFFREHGYGTWERLRASAASPTEIMIGKVIPAVGLAFVQQAVIFIVGFALFGLRVNGPVLLLPLIALAYAVSLVSFGVALAAVCRTSQQVNGLSSVGAMLFAGLGGSFVPLAALPHWAKLLAPFTPTYWTMRAFHSVIVDGRGIDALGLPLLILAALSLAVAALAATRFRFEETKVAVV